MNRESSTTDQKRHLADLDGRFGEGWSGEAPHGCQINLVIGRRGGPTAASAAAALAAPIPGHAAFLACAAPGTMIRPATVIVNRTTLIDTTLERLTCGALQLGIAQAVLDAVADGSLPAKKAADLTLLVTAWLDPALGDCEPGSSPDDGPPDGPAVDTETAIRLSARAATVAAIADALAPRTGKALRDLADGRDELTNRCYGGQ